MKAVSDEKFTAFDGVPTLFVAELGLPDFDSYDLSRLRTGIMAGAPCPIKVMRLVQSKMNMCEVTIAYGVTETSPVSLQTWKKISSQDTKAPGFSASDLRAWADWDRNQIGLPSSSQRSSSSAK